MLFIFLPVDHNPNSILFDDQHCPDRKEHCKDIECFSSAIQVGDNIAEKSDASSTETGFMNNNMLSS